MTEESFDMIEEAHALAKEMMESGLMSHHSKEINAICVASNPIKVCYDPKIIDFGNESVLMEEVWGSAHTKVVRPKNIKIRFTQPNGVTVTEKFSGLTSRLFQKECDALNGVMPPTSNLKKDILINRNKKLQKRKLQNGR